MDVPNLLPRLLIRLAHQQMPVKTAWTEKRRIKALLSVGCSKQNDVLPARKTIQLLEQFRENAARRLRGEITVFTDGINLINKDDALSLYMLEMSRTACSESP